MTSPPATATAPKRMVLCGCVLLWWSLLTIARSSSAAPLTQTLSKGPSFIKFGVESPSPTLHMNGHLQDFNGKVTLHPSGASISELQLMVNLESVQLPPDQLLQGIFIHSVLARFQQRSATFTSTTIDHVQGNTYLATGSYRWQNRFRNAQIPFQLIQMSPRITEIRILMRGGLTDSTTPKELSATVPEASRSSGWAKATLIFTNAKLT